MRSTTKLLAAACVGAAVLAGAVVELAGPAGAKGVASVTISGPGIPLDAPIEVSVRTHPDEWEDIYRWSGLQWGSPGLAGPAVVSTVGTEHLGPRHTLNWPVMTGPGEMTPIRQDLYLYADGGPLTYTVPGQPIWDDVTLGGWYRAPDALRQAVADVCVPLIGEFELSKVCYERQMAAKAASAKAQAAANAPAAAQSRDSSWPETIAGLTAFVALGLGGIGVLAVRRSRQRRRRVAPVPL